MHSWTDALRVSPQNVRLADTAMVRGCQLLKWANYRLQLLRAAATQLHQRLGPRDETCVLRQLLSALAPRISLRAIEYLREKKNKLKISRSDPADINKFDSRCMKKEFSLTGLGGIIFLQQIFEKFFGQKKPRGASFAFNVNRSSEGGETSGPSVGYF